MFPLIITGDSIIVSPEKNPAVGDIIVFRREDQMVCHRLVKVFEKDGVSYFQTRGDSFLDLDEPITVHQIKGKVIAIERGHVSFIRKLFLFIRPALKFGCLNALLVLFLRTTRNLLVPQRKAIKA